MSNCEPGTVLGQFADVLRWSRERDYRGHSKHDALNSPLLGALTFGNRFLQLAATQAVMRLPFNVRPLLAVPRLRNPKGIGLFAEACLDAAEYLGGKRSDGAGLTRGGLVEEASDLLGWLVGRSSPMALPTADLARRFDARRPDGGSGDGEGMLEGLGWGYHYPWRDVGFFQPAHFPNRVVTSWIGSAFLRALETTGEKRFLLAAREISAFLLNNPRRLADTPRQLCLNYVPLEEVDWAVMDVSALVSAFCARLASLDGESRSLAGESKRLMEFVVDKQTDYGAWFYTWPAGDSHIRHDNYHTGIILDCLADYMTFAEDDSWRDRYEQGLEYYRSKLFLENGAPRWMNDRTFPHDIHGAAAGILAFSRAALYCHERLQDSEGARRHFEFACLILKWARRNLFSGQGFFYYQKTRWMTKKFCLMRWCNAWMSRAMASLLIRSVRIGLAPEESGKGR
jgi:hypothetical protein